MPESEQPKMTQEQALALVAEKTGIPVSNITRKKVKVTPEMIKKLQQEALSNPAGGLPLPLVAEPEPTPILPPPAEQPVGIGAFDPVVDPRKLLEGKFVDMMQETGRLPKPNTEAQTLKSPEDALKDAESVPDDQKTDKTKYMEHNARLDQMVLSVRPPGAPSILEECRTPIKLMISQHQSPGDILMLTGAVRDLHMAYPGKFLTCPRTPVGELWDNNRYCTQLPDDGESMWHAAYYPLIDTSNQGAHHFIHGFRQDLEERLGLPIPATTQVGHIQLSGDERGWFSQVYENLEQDVPYWIIDAGCKQDYTCKQWEIAKYQQVVDSMPEIQFVQVGADNHLHKALTGPNLLNLVGKTNIREFVRLMYHAAGCITPVSFPMHLAAAVEPHPRYLRKTRPCIVIAGGREPSIWEAYTNHQFLHTCGMLPCCDQGGCWISRVMPIGDGDDKDYNSLCHRPTKTASGQIVPKCMDMISAEEVVIKVRQYMEAYHYQDDQSTWRWHEHEIPQEVVDKKAEVQGLQGVQR